jgi:hypothetical protein
LLSLYNGSSGFSHVTRLSPSCPLRNCHRQASAGSHLFVSAAGPVPLIRLRGRSSRSGYSDPEWREQRVCNLQDALKLVFKRPPSFCIHWRFSLSPMVKRRPTATSLGCPFFIAVCRFSAGDSLCVPRCRTIRSPAVLPGSIGWSTATILVRLPAAFCTRKTLSPKFPSLGLQLRDVSLQTVVGWKPDRGLYGSGLLSF